MIPRELFALSPINLVAWLLGWFVIAIWIVSAAYFVLVGVIHQIRKLVYERLQDDPHRTYPLKGI